MAAAGARGIYLSCFRNFSAVAEWILQRQYEFVAVLGAGTRGQFRIEDQMGCSWVAERLVQGGYEPENAQTREYIYKWRGASPEEALKSESVAYLRDSNQYHDVEFVLRHIDDLEIVPTFQNYEIVPAKE